MIQTMIGLPGLNALQCATTHIAVGVPDVACLPKRQGKHCGRIRTDAIRGSVLGKSSLVTIAEYLPPAWIILLHELCLKKAVELLSDLKRPHIALVPSCRECNSGLGPEFFESFGRKEKVRQEMA